VEYDWVRVGRFTLVFVIYAAAFSWPRDFSLALEIVLSGVATLLLAMLLFGLTAATERALLRSSIDRFLPARLGGSR
jgi:hypothetical protein